MSDYIDRDELLDRITKAEQTSGLNVIIIAGLETAYYMAKDMPSVDIEERKTGHWVDDYEYVCSVCGFECDDPYYLGSADYCPNCGARMEQ